MRCLQKIFGVLFLAALFVFAMGCAPVERETQPPLEIRVNAASEETYMDGEGRLWLADQILEEDRVWGAVGGLTVDRGDIEIYDTNAPGVYRTERYELEKYVFNVPPGAYKVRLHFAETFHGIAGPGERVYDVIINGVTALEQFDPFETASGLDTAIVKETTGVQAPDGIISIEFADRIQDVHGPMINGIEIIGQ